MNRTIETLIALLVIICLFALVWVTVIDVERTPEISPPMELGPVGVQTMVVEAGPVALHVRGFGTLKPLRRVPIAVEGAGRIQAVSEQWRIGGLVSEGEVLLRLEGAALELAEATAEAQMNQATLSWEEAKKLVVGAIAMEKIALESLEVATRELKRAESSLEKEITSEQLLDIARSQKLAAANAHEVAVAGRIRAESQVAMGASARKVARALYNQASEARSHQDFAAPFSGRFTMSAPEVGALVAPGSAASMALGELVDNSMLTLVTHIHENDLARLAIGQVASVTLPSRAGLAIEGKVHTIGMLSDPMTRSVAVEILIPNDVHNLPAGLFGEASVEVGTVAKAVVIQRNQFLWLEGKPLAYALGGQDGNLVAEQRNLVLGDSVGEGFLVMDGLQGGDTLLVSPLDRLAPREPGSQTPVRPLARAVGAERPPATEPTILPGSGGK